MRWFWIVSVVAVLFYGCGGEDRPSQITLNTGGFPGSAGTGGRLSSGGSGGKDIGAGGAGETLGGAGGEGGEFVAGGEGGESAIDPRAPIVEITSPKAVSDPDQGEVLLADGVSVLCNVSKSTASGALAVDSSTIKIAMLDAAGRVLKELGGAATANAREYSATFAVSNLANGVVRFRCTAGDIGATPRVGSTQISTFVDRGPMITTTGPKVNEVLPLKTAAGFEFVVEPAPLADGDDGAAVDDVTLTVLGVPIDVTPAPRRPGVYIATVDFTDSQLFPETPGGDIPTVITASNKRSPKAAVRTEAYVFKLDGEGPVIKISSPKTNEIVGPKTRVLTFTVTDTPSGVDKNTVTVTLNGVEFHYEPAPSAWTEKNGTYTFKFDGTQIKGSIAQATINVHAEDLVGNGADGESLIIYLDDYPPIVSLNPGKVRVMARATSPTGKARCSSAFDPLGKAISDEDTIQVAGQFRALVWDETNQAPGQTIVYYSAANKSSVFLYLQPDPAQPLLVDSNADGVCDEVNTKDKAGKDLVFVRLSPIESQGNFPNDADDLTTAEPKVAEGECELSTLASNYLCSSHTSDMTYSMKHTTTGGPEPVIYGRDPMAGNALACAGNSWELRGSIDHVGWVCLAAVASDNAQNNGISAPLRVCIDDDEDPQNASPCAGIPAPDCTDGCTPPPEFPSQVIRYAN